MRDSEIPLSRLLLVVERQKYNRKLFAMDIYKKIYRQKYWLCVEKFIMNRTHKKKKKKSRGTWITRFSNSRRQNDLSADINFYERLAHTYTTYNTRIVQNWSNIMYSEFFFSFLCSRFVTRNVSSFSRQLAIYEFEEI